MSCEIYTEKSSAMLDGELPPAEAAVLAAHIAVCPNCAKHLSELAGLRAALHADIPEEDVSPELRAKIAAMLDDAASNVIPLPVRRRRTTWIAAGAALAAALAIVLLPRHDNTLDLSAVRDAALRSAIPQMAAANMSGPAVPGFRLAAARADIVAGHPAKFLTYALADQTVFLCVWSANGEAAHGVRNVVYKGMAISDWNDGQQEYWAATAGTDGTLGRFVAGVIKG